MYPHFGHIHSEMGKENKIAFRNYIIYLNIYNKQNNSENVLPVNTLRSSEVT